MKNITFFQKTMRWWQLLLVACLQFHLISSSDGPEFCAADSTASDQCSEDKDDAGCGCATNRDKGTEKETTKDRWTEDKKTSYDGTQLKDEDGPDLDDMVRISSGTFFMGTNEPVFPNDGEMPARPHRISGFYLDPKA